MKKIAFLLLVTFCEIASAQVASTTQQSASLAQTRLLSVTKKLFSSKSDDDKHRCNEELLKTFEQILNEPGSFEYPFDSLKNDMAILLSPDNKFRIINWNVPKNDGTQEYFGFIQEKYVQVIKKGLFKKTHTESVQLYQLTDKSAETKNPENAITDNKKWFGMLYYKILINKTKSKTYYTLLAWDGNDKFSSKKIIDVLTFDQNGTPRFGADIFNMQKKYPKRVIFEYSATCNMSMRYSNKKDSIIFDHLSPTSPQLEGQFQYYCSDMSYDGFGFRKGKWNYGTDLNATNDKDDTDKLYKDPHDITHTNNESNQFFDKRKRKKKK